MRSVILQVKVVFFVTRYFTEPLWFAGHEGTRCSCGFDCTLS